MDPQVCKVTSYSSYLAYPDECPTSLVINPCKKNKKCFSMQITRYKLNQTKLKNVKKKIK